MRLQLRDIVHATGQRHAYMPDITEAAFAGGLRCPQDAVIAVGRFLAKRLRGVRSIECDSPGGTRLSLTLNQAAGWVARLGEVEPGRTTPFPAGTLFATPKDVRGTFVADASLGEFLGAHEGVLSEKAVRFTLDGGRVTRVDAGDNTELKGQVEALLRVSPNSNRVGLVCIGVNEGVCAPTGDSAADCLIVGLHLFIGDPAGRSTGAAWTARTSLAACQATSRVRVDGRAVIEGGRVL
jgi:leucyl aminopeptidase (aminopeptidase T)